MKNSDFRGMLGASSIGLVFVFSIIIGTGMGYWLDKQFNTKPVLTIIFMILGIISGLKNAWMFIKRSGAMDDIKDEERD
jgi:ATP synthase protein I